jgi:hypothetical protein
LIIPFTSTEVLPVPKLAQRRSHLNAFDQRGFRCGSRFLFSIEGALFSPFFSAPFTLSYEGQGMFPTRISGVFLGRAAASQTSAVDPLPASPGMACWMRRSRSISVLAVSGCFPGFAGGIFHPIRCISQTNNIPAFARRLTRFKAVAFPIYLRLMCRQTGEKQHE